MKRGTDISSFLRPLSDNPLQVVLSNRFQIADIMEWCLHQIAGGVTIYQTSFSISDEYLRRLHTMRKKVTIEDLHIVLDEKATNKTLLLWPFLSQTVEHVYLAENHSKIILIQPSDKSMNCVSIISSQNLTRGNRYESTIVTTDKSVYDNLHKELNEIIQHRSINLTEIFRQRIYGKTNSYQCCSDNARIARTC